MSSKAEQVARALNAERVAFKAFLVKRLGSEADAEDVLQNGLVKALRRADEIRQGDKMTAWFYQILRNSVIDVYRSRGAGRKRDDGFRVQLEATGEDVAAVPPEWEAQVCSCLGGVIRRLKPQYAELLERVEIKGEPVKEAARRMGLSANNASVTLHRARKELRQQLEAFCGECAAGACLDCDCGPGKTDT